VAVPVNGRGLRVEELTGQARHEAGVIQIARSAHRVRHPIGCSTLLGLRSRIGGKPLGLTITRYFLLIVDEAVE
jgi:hypothetical protein